MTLPLLAPSLEALLFGRGGPAWVASVAPGDVQPLLALAEELGPPRVPVRVLGTVVPQRLRLAVEGAGTVLDEPVEPLRRAWRQALEEAARP
ncbi:MAG: hypothetical protein IMX02_11520 [Limnochordaceae bacterium]|nr:hypothetical protein [Limnochordaceae bacterium]